MTEPERQPDPIAALLSRAVELDAAERVAARDRFLQRVDGELQRSKPYPLVRYALAAAVLSSLLGVFFLWGSDPGLEYTVHGAASDGDYVQAAADRSASITFSDRSRIEAAAGTRLRIDEPTERTGAHVSVERGRVDVEVIHAQSTSWKFKAGPFEVAVVGTRFTLGWNADAEQLELVLHDGAVDVEGYIGSGVVSVRAGQRFLGDAKRRTMLVSDVAPPREPEAAPPPATPAAAEGLEPQDPASGTVASKPSPEPRRTTQAAKVTWSELVARGAFRQVVDEATSMDDSDCLESCSAEDLNALADAARYVGDSALSERTLLALRARPGSGYRVRAGFLLGRLHEGRGEMALAKTWYETALREDPSGAFASEALSGKMRTVNALQGSRAARAVAREYLRLYPDGVHAKAARDLAAGP